MAVAFFSPKKDKKYSENDTLKYPKEENSSSWKSTYSSQHTTKRYTPRRTVSKAYESAQAQAEEPTAYSEPYRRKPLTVELNSADTTTLMLLHGIGPTYARRITQYRERLGGFVDEHQLLEVYGISPELLEHIAPHITLDAENIQRMPINSIPLKQLIRHPYIEYYQARDIVRLRDRGIRFRSADDLRTVPSMTDSVLQRLLPYLDFEQ